MFAKLGSFFKSFFKNIAADPVTSLKGVVSLAAAGATAYGMATGKVPVNELSIGAAGAMTTSGLHALGTDATGATAPAAEQAIALVETATAMAPTALAVTQHYEAIKQEQGKALAVLAAITEASAALSAVPAAAPAPVEPVKVPSL